MGDNFDGRSTHHNKPSCIEEGHSGTGGEGGRNTPLEYRKYQFSNEFGPAVAYNHQNYQNKLPKLH